jgi:hypothetical protein
MGGTALVLLNGPLHRWNVAGNVAGWTVAIGVVMLAGSLVGLILTEESGRRRRLYVRLFAGIVTLAVVLATAYFALLWLIGCGMSPDSYNDWVCRGSSVYWPSLLAVIVATWIVTGGLVRLVLRRASIDSA